MCWICFFPCGRLFGTPHPPQAVTAKFPLGAGIHYGTLCREYRRKQPYILLRCNERMVLGRKRINQQAENIACHSERSVESSSCKSNLEDPYSMLLCSASTQAVAKEAQDDKTGEALRLPLPLRFKSIRWSAGWTA